MWPLLELILRNEPSDMKSKEHQKVFISSVSFEDKQKN